VKKLSRKEGLAVAEAVHTWVNSANADEIQQEIYRWTKKKHKTTST